MQPGSRDQFDELARISMAEGMVRGMAKGMVEGEVRGRAESVLVVLSARGLEVPDDVRAQISACADLARLEDLIRSAVTVDSARTLLS
ncbi:hypothetical protein DPM19_07575 [Actinomadura craniellae]|uniref:Uncharacterized protein n=1 Tax=Actinomadura craniellae TaxID=2231787 RepID=A0A365H988_9ACTN|nr:hypothetical protein [Actinomadura craniellae]RAY15641.1 hypothetical protein DPM19_07575 [Actinomadura craniellae]